MTTVALLRDKFDNHASVFLHDDEIVQFEARLAINLIEQWGMLLAEENGEDTAGRQKVRPLTPAEVVLRACEIAEIAARELRARNWLTKGPTVDDVIGFKK